MQTDPDVDPRVVGGDPTLQQALDGTRVWAVTEDGFLVETRRYGEDADTPAQLSSVDGDGRATPLGPGFKRIISVQVIGDQLVVDDLGLISSYDVDTGQEVEPEPLVRPTTRRSIASSIVLVGSGDDDAGVVDAGSEARLDYAELRDRGATGDIRVAGSSVDRVLLAAQSDGGGAQYWTWSSADGLRESYASTDPGTREGRGSTGVCGDYLYVAEHGELRVIDTARDPQVVSRRAFDVDASAGGGYEVIAIPGGVLVSSGSDEATRIMWFDE